MLGTGFFMFYAVAWLHLQSYFSIIVFGSMLVVLSLLVYRRTAGRTNIKKIIRDRNTYHVLLIIIATGVILRMSWVVLVPPVQLSDYKDYLEAAHRLIYTGSYYYIYDNHVLYAWRPPGYPFFLAACIFLWGDHPAMPTIINLIFYLLTSILVYRIVIVLSGEKKAGLFAVLILALWPSYIAITGLAASEHLSILLFTAVFWFFWVANKEITDRHSWIYAGMTGLLTGYGALVKPPLQMLPVLWILYILMLKKERKFAIRNAVIALLSMAIIILPWTIRNYYKLGGLVAISSNGGDVFYRANNPMASGSFERTGERDLTIYLSDEILWSKKGFEWGKEWIKQHPIDFIKLSIKKMGLLLGEDTSGIYWTLERGHQQTGIGYKILLAFSDFWWITVWILVICGTIRSWHYLTGHASGGLLLWMILFFVVVHSVFESHSRYHMPMIGLLSVLAAFTFPSSYNCQPGIKKDIQNSILK